MRTGQHRLSLIICMSVPVLPQYPYNPYYQYGYQYNYPYYPPFQPSSDSETLRKIYDDINRLEKSTIEHFGYKEYSELFYYFLIPGLILLLLEILLANTIFMKVP